MEPAVPLLSFASLKTEESIEEDEDDDFSESFLSPSSAKSDDTDPKVCSAPALVRTPTEKKLIVESEPKLGQSVAELEDATAVVNSPMQHRQALMSLEAPVDFNPSTPISPKPAPSSPKTPSFSIPFSESPPPPANPPLKRRLSESAVSKEHVSPRDKTPPPSKKLDALRFYQPLNEDLAVMNCSSAALHELFQSMYDKFEPSDSGACNPAKALILTYHSVGSAQDLLSLIYEKVHQPDQVAKDNACRFLAQWIFESPKDIQNDATLLRIALRIAEDTEAITQSEKSELQNVLLALDVMERSIYRMKSLFGRPSGYLAKHFTMAEWRHFSKINPTEFLDQSWMKAGKSPNIQNLTTRFNHVSSWVASKILGGATVAERVIILEATIEIMIKLYSYGNYNGAIAFLAGLNMSSIQRLKQTWKHISGSSREKYSAVELFFDPQDNFGTYRKAIASWMESLSTKLNKKQKTTTPRSLRKQSQSTAKIERRAGCIPYLALMLRDLTHIDENRDNTIEAKVFKTQMVASTIEQLKTFQSIAYCYEEEEVLSYYIAGLPGIMTEKEMYEESLRLEKGVGRNSASSSDASITGTSPTTSPRKRLSQQESIDSATVFERSCSTLSPRETEELLAYVFDDSVIDKNSRSHKSFGSISVSNPRSRSITISDDLYIASSSQSFDEERKTANIRKANSMRTAVPLEERNHEERHVFDKNSPADEKKSPRRRLSNLVKKTRRLGVNEP